MVLAKLSRLMLLFCFVVCESSSAAIIWAGGEDVDFPNGNTPVPNAGGYRAGYARHALGVTNTGDTFWSNSWGAALTSVWITARVWKNSSGTNLRWFGLGKYGTWHSLWVGSSASNTNRIAIFKWDGSTLSQLAAESGTTLSSGVLHKIDMQVTNYGAAATVNVYINGALSPAVTYTGDVTTGGNASLDNVFLSGGNVSFRETYISEVIVADQDTRLLSLVTHAPSAAGGTNTFTSGSHTDVNETTLSDATVVSSNTSGQNFQANLTDLPSGSFSVQAVKINARSSKTGAGIGSLAVGVVTNSTSSVPAATSLSTSWLPVETLYQLNPVTSSAWTPTELNALQINLQSAP